MLWAMECDPHSPRLGVSGAKEIKMSNYYAKKMAQIETGNLTARTIAAEAHAANTALAADGVALVELIQTEYQTGLVNECIRPWDGTPSLIGTVEPRNGREDGVRMIQRPTVVLPW